MKRTKTVDWAADTRPSLPSASQHTRYVKMGGFAFTQWGLVFDLSPEEVEEMSHPPFAPPEGING